MLTERSNGGTAVPQGVPILGPSGLTKTKRGYESYRPLLHQWPIDLRGQSRTQDPAVALGQFDADDDDLPVLLAQTSQHDLLALLPPASFCDELKEVYLRVFAPLFHVLHDPTFCEEYAAFQSCSEDSSLSWLALLYAVFAVAVTALDEDSHILKDLGRSTSRSANVALLTKRYRAAALHCLQTDQFLWRHNLHTLQALIILIYGISHTHGPAWALLGLSRNVAVSIGCHVDPDELGLEIIEAEQRRRCWAALNMLHTSQNVSLGGLDPTPLPSNVKMPLDVDDDEIGHVAGDLATNRGWGSASRPSQMSYLLYKFRLYKVSSQICGCVSSASSKSLPEYDEIQNLDGEISQQHDIWNCRYITDSSLIDLPHYQTVQINILFIYSHHLILLLHRPVIMQEIIRSANRQNRHYTISQSLDSRRRCIESACVVLEGFERLHMKNEFRPYRWYTNGLGSFYAFHAALFLSFVSTAPYNALAAQLPRIQNLLQGTLRIFEEIADRGMSRICPRAVPVLRRVWYVTTGQRHHRLILTFFSTIRSAGHDRPGDVPNPVNVLSPAKTTPPRERMSFLPGNQPEPDNPEHLGFFLDSLQPQYWLSPASMDWNAWTNWDIGTTFNLGLDTLHE
jgi:hypothetical protein